MNGKGISDLLIKIHYYLETVTKLIIKNTMKTSFTQRSCSVFSQVVDRKESVIMFRVLGKSKANFSLSQLKLFDSGF